MLLVRHAQSAWNDEGRWQGRADPPLSELGRRQALAAATRVGAVDAIVTSTLERARHTAEILAEAVGIGPVVHEPELVERDVGEWSGLTRAEIERDWPGYLADARRPPGFEDDDELLARVLPAITRIASVFDGADVLVVTHGGVIRTLERHLGELAGALPNLAGRAVVRTDSGLVLGERVTLLDDDDLTVVVPAT